MALTKVPSNLDSITATTQSASDNSTNVATTAYVTTAVSNLVDGAPSTLNTLNEIAAALNDDAALNTTLTTSIADKLPLGGGTLVGTLTLSYDYPRINLTDTNHDSDYSIINNNGAFGVYDVTNAAYRLQINSSGNLTVSGHITASGTNNIYVGDNGKFTAGGGDDLQIYHDGTNSHIYNNTGYTTLRTAANNGYLYLHGDNVHLRGQTANETLLTAVLNGAVTLYHDNTARLETTTNGISVKGTSSNLITTSSTANDRAGAGFTATESSTDSTRRATMYLDADNGAFSTGDSGAYFYMEKVGGGGQVNFINQDTSGYNFRTGGSHVRMNIGSTGKTSWSAGGIGNAATQDRDFTFYTEGSSNGVDIRSNDYRNILLGAGGSSGSAVDAGYIGIYKDGVTKIALNANGNNFLKGGHVFVDNGVGVATFTTMDANGHTWQTDTYNTLTAGGVAIGTDSSNTSHMWWNVYDTGSKYAVSSGYGMDQYVANSNGYYAWRFSDNASSAGSGVTLTTQFQMKPNGMTHIGQGNSNVQVFVGSQGGEFGGNSSHNMRASSNLFMFNAAGTSAQYIIEINGANRGSVTSSSATGVFSDRDMKENIQDIGKHKTKQTANVFKMLAHEGIPTSFIKIDSPNILLCHRCNMFPLDFVVRRYEWGLSLIHI